RRWRVALGVLLVVQALAAGVVTVTVTADSADPYAAMSTSGSASIVAGVGLALLAPLLLRAGAAVAGRLPVRGAAWELALHTASRRAHLLGGVLAPVVVLTAASIGTLVLVGIDGRTLPEGAALPEAGTITMLNNVVVGMLSLFAAVVVVNTAVAVTAARRAELHRLRLLGATRAQVLGAVLAEAGVVAAVGVVAGALAALTTTVPFGIAREEGFVPDGQLWLPPLLACGVVALTLGATFVAVRRVVPATGTATAARVPAARASAGPAGVATATPAR
ncbi:FtsX-like permease family protein, partial [Kineococcus glutinatus]|uniref:FtsX-like permease family protein n=1 Tax=Kineococcus glutinatus TaxID=1070872 RepID=UPI0031ED9055